MHLSGDPRYGQIDATPSWIHYLIYFGDCGTVGYSSLTFVASFPVLYTEGVWRILYLFVGNFVPVVVVVFGRKIKKKFAKLRYELLCRITKSKGNHYVQ